MGHEKDKYLKYRFPGQKEGETIQLLVRKHWIVDVEIASIFLVLGVPPIIAAGVSAFEFWNGTAEDTFLGLALALWIYLLIATAFTYMKWLNEELDIIIITNERVVSHDQVNLFHRQISETSISQVQDVKGVEKGVLGNVLHYGTLEIQTAAKDIVFRIGHVNKPYQSARLILDVREKHMDKEKFETAPVKEQSSPVFDL